MAPVREIDIERFRALVARWLGLEFDAAKGAFLARVLEQQAGAEAAAAYLDRLDTASRPGAEIAALARELTVPETYFFRHRDQFKAFSEVALRERTAAHSPGRRLNLLSAGCASGEEAYSLSILVKESGLGPNGRVALRAVDVNASVLERAARAVYSAWSLRETPEDIAGRWFVRRRNEFELDPKVRASVSFEERNLAIEQPDLWLPAFFDVVFCRNLLMYFTADAARALVERIAHSLVPGGYLFIGHAETLRGLSEDFDLCDSHGTFYYRRRGGRAIVRERTTSPPPARWTDGAGVAIPAWVETVQRAADRIQRLATGLETAAPQAPPGPAAGSPGSGAGAARSPGSGAGVASLRWPFGAEATPGPSGELAPVLEGLRCERFADGLELLARLPPDRASTPEAVLLRAVLLVHTGRLAAAEKTCGELLDREVLCASACYVLALCREAVGDTWGAFEHDLLATSIDPTFAMPRLHLGLMARRAGDRGGARRELDRAAALLLREDSFRIALFGAGFGRAGLLALCHAELTPERRRS